MVFLFVSGASAFASTLSEKATAASERQRENRQYNESHRQIVERTWRGVIGRCDKRDADKLRRVRIIYSIDDTPLRFEANTGEQPILLVTTGGLRLQNVILEAYALFGSGYVDQEWIFQYMLYLRRQHLSHSQFHSPRVAAGLKGAELSGPLNPIFEWLSANYQETILIFTLAHEAAHFIYQDVVEQADEESDKAFEHRMQLQEARADRFAVDMMTKQAQFVAAFNSLLLGTIIIYEPRNSVADANLHIPDRLRLRTITGWVRDALARDTRVPDNERSMINGGLEQSFMFTDPSMYHLFLAFRDSRLQHPIFNRLKLPDSMD